MAKTPWDGYSSSLDLRAYQERAMASFQQVLSGSGERLFYLVAPPGAGKTLLGLLMSEALELPTVSLSPNAAIQAQWLERLKEHWVCLDSTLEAFEPHPRCSDQPDDEPQALISLTYQRITVRGRDGSVHPNVTALLGGLSQAGVRCVLLDECHHLSNEWGRAVEALNLALGAPFIIGLTATPVTQDEGPMARLLGEPNHEISLPSVIRSGDLAPFQDLCHLVAPSQEEEDDLQGSLARFTRLFGLCNTSEPDRFGLSSWLDMLALSPASLGGAPYPDLLDMFKAEPELITALCRQRSDEQREPPAILPYLPELYEPATLTDRLLLVAHYTARYLLPELPDAALGPEAVEVLADWGLEVKPGVVNRRVGRISRALGFTRQKLDAMVEILRTEMRVMGDDLRALIITDYENPPRDELSCVDVMDTLTSIDDVDELDPILITGQSLLVDDDLWGKFKSSCEQRCAKEGWELNISREAERGYWRMGGSGPNWNTRVQVTLVTMMLEAGISRCLISTRALLGEGWDCLRLNTLIDLTVVTSGVAVNQIRGRTMRQDPERPLKVANNWDVLCLSSVGDRADLQRLRQRHDKLYGITDDGQIERGIGHIHACFNQVSTEDLFGRLDAINQIMHRRAEERLDARERWRVGQPFEDQDHQVMTFTLRRRKKKQEPAAQEEALAVRQRSADVIMFPSAQQRARKELLWTIGVGAAATAGIVGLAVGLWAPLAVLALGPLVATPLRLRATSRERFFSSTMEAELASLAQVVAAAFAALEGAQCEVLTSRRDDGTVRVKWRGVDTEQSERLSAALAELLGPVISQRYLMVEELVAVKGASFWSRLSSNLAPVERVFPVPRMFARKRDARHLHATWQELRNTHVSLHHAQSEQGKEVARRALHCRALEGETAIRTVWD